MPPFDIQRDRFLAGQGDERARDRLREKGRRGGLVAASNRRQAKVAGNRSYSLDALWRIWDELKASPM